MKRIFINYRRGNSGGYALMLRGILAAHFPNVFMDIASINPGEDFRDVIEKTWPTCGVVLAIIGPDWATVRDDSNKLRLLDENDFVRLEITAALRKEIPIIPVLVGGAQMPGETDLPPDLKLLAFRQAHEISDTYFDEGIQRLVEVLNRILSPPQASTHIAPRPEFAESASSAPALELSALKPSQMLELEGPIQEGGELLILPETVAVVVVAVEPLERDQTYSARVLRNMKAGARYDFFFGDFATNIERVAHLLSNFATVGLISSDAPLRESSAAMQRNLDTVRTHLHFMRRNLAIHFRRRPPIQFCVHNPRSEEAAICYLWHKQRVFVRWAERREAWDIAAETSRWCITPRQGDCIFHSTDDFSLDESATLGGQASEIRRRREALLRSMQKQFPPELHQDLNQVCLGT